MFMGKIEKCPYCNKTWETEADDFLYYKDSIIECLEKKYYARLTTHLFGFVFWAIRTEMESIEKNK